MHVFHSPLFVLNRRLVLVRYGLCLAIGVVIGSICDPMMLSPRMPSAENTLLGRSVAHADDTELPAFLRQRFSIRASNRRDNGDMIQLIRPLAESIAPSVVQIVSDGTPVSLGTIVSSDGYVLTKRSELSGDPIRVRLGDARLLPARVAAVRRKSDLALIRIEGAGGDLRPITFAAESDSVVGSFLVSVGRTGVPIGLGAVSVRPRTVEHNGRLGVVLVDERGQATVRGVWPDSGAESAGIRQGDQIIAIDDRHETSRNAVIQALRGMFPGESVKLTINREGETLNLVAKIQDFGVMQETENDTKVNGPRSTRLSGFERVLQHDTVLNPDECGGPVMDTSGRVVGMNIARAGRVVSYALPASLLVPEITSMLAEARGQTGGK
jgi:S1-C subfamily serine protease